MELMVALMVLFLGGASLYGAARLRTGSRDLRRLIGLALSRTRPVLLRDAALGKVLLRGRARAIQRLLPTLTGGDGSCLAQESRGGLGIGRTECSIIFEIEDGTGVARVDARHVEIVAPDADDLFGGLTREIHPGDIVLVEGRLCREIDLSAPLGSYREPPTALVIRDDAERGVRLVRPTMTPLKVVGKGLAALSMAGLALWFAVNLLG
jgi:hypothetical protein